MMATCTRRIIGQIIALILFLYDACVFENCYALRRVLLACIRSKAGSKSERYPSNSGIVMTDFFFIVENISHKKSMRNNNFEQ